MKKYLYKNRYFIDDDPEFVGFFSAAVVDDDEPHHGPPYVMLELGDDFHRGFSWLLDLGKRNQDASLERLRQFAASARNLYLAALNACKKTTNEDADQVNTLMRKTKEIADMLDKDIFIVMQDRKTGRGWTTSTHSGLKSEGIKYVAFTLGEWLTGHEWNGERKK